MITRNSLIIKIAIAILCSANVVHCKTLNEESVLSTNNYETPLQPLSVGSVSLKSVYHRAENTYNIENKLQRIEISSVHSESISSEVKLNLKRVRGTAYRPSTEFRERAIELARQKKLLRFEPSPLNAQDALQPEPYILPDVTDSDTMLAFGKISYNAYTKLGSDKDWYDLGDEWAVKSTFGWDSDGLRGHVFGNSDNSLFVISFKGTTAGLFNGEPTGERDKLNDNLLFSCCCGKVNRGWTAVCGCNDPNNQYQCDNQCLDKSLIKAELYYDYAAHIFMDVSDRFPNATIWLTGHSLGGAVASLIGQTFGVPAVSFESPGDRLAAQRLHLPRAPGAADLPIWHFGHTADPIYIGVCTGPTSGCFYAGFAMETRCHTGKVCVWDTVKDNGWRVNIAYHRIATIIESILKNPTEFPLPKCKVQTDCDECGLWTFKDDRDNILDLSSTNNRIQRQSSCNLPHPPPLRIQ